MGMMCAMRERTSWYAAMAFPHRVQQNGRIRLIYQDTAVGMRNS